MYIGALFYYLEIYYNKVAMKKYLSYIIPIILLLVIATGFFIYSYQQKHPRTPPVKWVNYTNEEFKVKLSYPETFKSTEITEDDKKAKIIFRAEQTEPSALLSLRYEEKLGMLRIAQKGSVLDALSQNIENQYPKRFPDFKKEKDEAITVDGVETKQFYFTYLGTDNQTRMKQRFIIVTRDYEAKDLGTVAFYLSFQSKESDFDKVNVDFQKILDSFKFQ